MNAANEATRYDQKQTIAAYERQIQNLQQLLNIQLEETHHSQEHVLLLNREIDALRKIIQEKQNALQDVQKQLRKKQDYGTELEKKYDQSKIDGLAFFKLEERNLQLLNGLKESKATIDKLEVELRYLREQREDRLLLEENKAKRALELEISFPFERNQLQVRLDQAQSINNKQALRLQQLETQVQSLTEQLSSQQERFSDHLQRSKQSEFKLLQQLDRETSNTQSLDLDRTHLQQRAIALTQQAQELTAQLQLSSQQTEDLQTIFAQAIQTLERDLHSASVNTQLLRRENLQLQLTQQIQEEIIARSSIPKPRNNTSRDNNNSTSKSTKGLGPLSLSATMPSRGNTRNTSRGSTSHMNSTGRDPASSSSKSLRRSPLRRFEPSTPTTPSLAASSSTPTLPTSSSRVSTAIPQYSNQIHSSNDNNDNSDNSNNNSSSSDELLSPLQTPATRSADIATADSNSRDAFSPAASRILSQTQSLGLSQRVTPQTEILALDLKNTLLHRHLHFICRLFQLQDPNNNNTESEAATDNQSRGTASAGDADDDDDDGLPPGFRSSRKTNNNMNTTMNSNVNVNNHMSSSYRVLLEEVNLSHCTLVDADLDGVVDWLRGLPASCFFRTARRLNLCHNLLTGAGLQKLLAWVLSWSPADFAALLQASTSHPQEQTFPLEIDLRFNQITPDEVEDGLRYLHDLLILTAPSDAFLTASADPNSSSSGKSRRLGLGVGNGQEVAMVAWRDTQVVRDRRLLFHVKTTLPGYPQGTAVALALNLNNQRGRGGSSCSKQLTLQFREPLVSKIQMQESLLPVLSATPTTPAQVEQGIPRDLIMQHDFIG